MVFVQFALIRAGLPDFQNFLSPDCTERPEWSGCGMRTCSKSGSRAEGARSSNSELPIANLQFRVYILVVILA